MKLRNHMIISYIKILSNYTNGMKFPVKIKYAISKNLEKLQKEYSFYEEQLKELYDKHGEKDDNDNLVPDKNGIPKIKEGHEAEFQTELTDLLNIEVKLTYHFVDEDTVYYDDLNGQYMILDVAQSIELASVLCKPEESPEDGKEKDKAIE